MRQRIGEWVLARDSANRLELRSTLLVSPRWPGYVATGLGLAQIGFGLVAGARSVTLGWTARLAMMAILGCAGTLFIAVGTLFIRQRRFYRFDGRRGRLVHVDSFVPSDSFDSSLRRVVSASLERGYEAWYMVLHFDDGVRRGFSAGTDERAAGYLLERVRAFVARRASYPDLAGPVAKEPGAPRHLRIAATTGGVRYSWRLLRPMSPPGLVLGLFFLVFASGIPLFIVAVAGLIFGFGDRDQNVPFALGGGVMSAITVVLAMTIAQPLLGRGVIVFEPEFLECLAFKGLRPLAAGTHRFARQDVEGADIQYAREGGALLIILGRDGQRCELPIPLGAGHFDPRELLWIKERIEAWTKWGRVG